ncbi:hypothetical protein EVJ58_g5517, partial [Rhodofomes roseus]
MRPSSSILFLAVPLLASAVPTFLKRANSADVTVLQFAGVLEDLETQFYTQALSKFQASDFTTAGFTDPNVPIQQFTAIGKDEATHLSFIGDALKSLGAATVSGCQFDFSSALTDVATMAPIARTVENVGVAAYLGAANLIKDPTILTAAATILTVEARHQTILNLVNNATSIPQAFDIPLTPNEVLAIAGGFISGCSTGITANTALAISNTGSIVAGTTLTFTSTALKGNQANIAARHDKGKASGNSMGAGSTGANGNSTSMGAAGNATSSGTSSKGSMSSGKGMNSGAASMGMNSGASSKDMNSGATSKGMNSGSSSKGMNSGSSSKGMNSGSSSKDQNKNSGSSSNNNNSTSSSSNSTSSANSTCSASSQLFCQIMVGGATTSMSMAIDSCKIPDGLNGPAAVFVTCDENTLPNDVVARAANSGSVLAGPTIIFIDVEVDILAGLSKTGASCEGSGNNNSASSSSSSSAMMGSSTAASSTMMAASSSSSSSTMMGSSAAASS